MKGIYYFFLAVFSTSVWPLDEAQNPVASILSELHRKEANLEKVSQSLLELPPESEERKDQEKAIEIVAEEIRREALNKLKVLVGPTHAEWQHLARKAILMLAEAQDGVNVDALLSQVAEHGIQSYQDVELHYLIDKYYQSDLAAVPLFLETILKQSQSKTVVPLALYRSALRNKALAEAPFVSDAKSRQLFEHKARELFSRLQQNYPNEKLYFQSPMGVLASQQLHDLTVHAVGQKVAEVEGGTNAKKQVKLSQLPKGPKLLFFFGDWCPHSRELYVQLKKWQERYPSLQILGVSNDDPKELSRALIEANITWPVIQDGPDGPLQKEWAIRTWPTIHLLDSDHKLRFKGLSPKDLEKAFHDLFSLAAQSGPQNEMEHASSRPEPKKTLTEPDSGPKTHGANVRGNVSHSSLPVRD